MKPKISKVLKLGRLWIYFSKCNKNLFCFKVNPYLDLGIRISYAIFINLWFKWGLIIELVKK